MGVLNNLGKNYRELLTVIGIVIVLGSWLVIPLAGYYLYKIPAIDTAFLLTVFWTGVWSLNVLRKSYIEF
jgi:hypothetical protein